MNPTSWRVLSADWAATSPAVVLLACALAIALVDLWARDPRRRLTYLLTQAALAVVALMHWAMFGDPTVYAMDRMVVSDSLGHLLALFSAVAVMVTLAYSREYAGARDLLKGELFTLSLFSLLGIEVMVSANNFLVIYLGLELMTLSLYALTALRRDQAEATEAAMKYFVLGALASGFLLYGLSMMYGAASSLDIGMVLAVIRNGTQNPGVLILAVVFIVAGLGFKLGAVPFHMWVPDVYQGAPTAVTLLIGGAPKLAAFAITIRLLVEGVYGRATDWQQMLVVLSIGSMLLGNVVAIAQTNLKRMLAYSSIAQMGFMLLGLCAGVAHGSDRLAPNAYSSSTFYIVAYVLTTLGSFGMIMLLSRPGFEADRIDDLKGLAKRSPWFALVMTILMLSLAGLPPTVGFYAKLLVLQALVATDVTGYAYLAVAAVVFSLIGAYYYLRIIKVMFFDEPLDREPLGGSVEVRAVLSLNGLAVLALGILPGGLIALCAQAISRALTT